MDYNTTGFQYGVPNGASQYGYNLSGYQANNFSDFGNFGSTPIQQRPVGGMNDDLLGMVPPPIQGMDGSFRAASAIDLFPEIFDAPLLQKMGLSMNPQGGGFGLGSGASFNSQYSAMMANKINQPMITYDSKGKATQGASWNEFEYAMRNGRRGERENSGGWFS